MRLQAIKLAGFKSFVDATTVPFPNNLCAVVGPNGCGKSNIIDAIRWVMGEGSAKNLRGESMTDVIFNGASNRKPVGQATIELLFDNSAGRLTGEYAAYSEISIKRQVSRDGQSSYFLNSVKCRRKDITDIFLGTGLGPRSYSIIEQGMISQLIEAKPEELRVYLEEAAGISKYKERRKETERRISHTRDNLDRLTDLREELERQIHHLERQAKNAERYTEFKKEEREVSAQLSALRWQNLDQKAGVQQQQIDQFEIELQARISDQRRVEAEIVALRDQLIGSNDSLAAVQQRFYDEGTEIARIEESIQYQSERARTLADSLRQTDQERTETAASLGSDEALIRDLAEQLERLAPEQAALSDSEIASKDQLEMAEHHVAELQQRWDQFTSEAAKVAQAGEIEQSKIALLEDSLQRLNQRLKAVGDDKTRLSEQAVAEEIGPLEAMIETQEEQVGRIQSEFDGLASQLQSQRVQNEQLSRTLNEQRSEMQHLAGRRASLDALQQAALGQAGDDTAWVSEQGLESALRVGESLEVEAGWEEAVEAVLGDALQGILVSNLRELSPAVARLTQGSITLLGMSDTHAPVVQGEARVSLAAKIQSSAELSAWLSHVFVAEDLEDALSLAENLAPDESVVTRDGLWMGASWIRVSADKDVTAGVLQRQKELTSLIAQIEALETLIDTTDEELAAGAINLTVLEQDRDALQSRLAEQQRAYGETRARLTAKRIQAEQIASELERADREITHSQAQLETDSVQLQAARSRLGGAMDEMEGVEATRAELAEQRHSAQQALVTLRQQAQADRDANHQLALRTQNLTAQLTATGQAITRLSARQTSLLERKQTLEADIAALAEPTTELQANLQERLQTRQGIEAELLAGRQVAQKIEFDIRSNESQRALFEEGVDQVRGQLEKARLEFQTLDVKRSTIEDLLKEAGAVLQEVISAMPEDADIPVWETELTKIENRIQRLGAINLAAIEEYKVQAERKAYLDAQNDDLEKALDTLMMAIRKIDIETRTRFKETFDLVNTKLQQLFPKLFGGGHAYLEMTGEDLLDTGVALMARPPGKRNSSIHLLSGGEKALTAIALVFSIFSLNPAPFCLLDEVDAPLDDANVMRYSELVKEMSRTVQFIYITHNKVAMEMAEQLMGVTMHEPGVSRLVSVDVEEAVAMSAV
ncbi:chromosome segregation protein SMC [Pseudomonadales bacterium]|jgi:chromosome segregation protein|nr:chromosome segregation protein SMC [Pseudomonadales bacterium]